MTYQEIQDWADLLADATLGYASLSEVKADIYDAKPTIVELNAIKTLSGYYCQSAMGEPVDWDKVEAEIVGILNDK